MNTNTQFFKNSERKKFLPGRILLSLLAMLLISIPIMAYAASHIDMSVLKTAIRSEMQSESYPNKAYININRTISPQITLNDAANFTYDTGTQTATGYPPGIQGFTTTARITPKSASLAAVGSTATFSDVATITYPSQAMLSDGSALDIVVNITSISITTKERLTKESPAVFVVLMNGQYGLWMGNTTMTSNLADVTVGTRTTTVNGMAVTAEVSFKYAGTNTQASNLNVPFLLADIDITGTNETVGVSDNLAWGYLPAGTNLNTSVSGGMIHYSPAENYGDVSSDLEGSFEGANAVAFITNPVSSFSISHQTSWSNNNSTQGASYELFPLEIDDIARGSIQINKSSANTGITGGNAAYSLAGAVYGVYSSHNDAVAGGATGRITTITTNSSGTGSASGLQYGTYYIREITAPTGYALDPSVKKVTVKSTSTVTVDVTDIPLGDPVTAMVNKVDAETGGAYTGAEVAQMDGTLGGAEFTVRYYDGYYNNAAAAEASGAPTKSWIIVTDNTGRAFLEEDYLSPLSDSLYYNELGFPVIPLGTVLTQERTPPQGYLLPDQSSVDVQQITVADPGLGTVTAYNEIQISDSIIRGDIALSKFFAPDESVTGFPEPEPDITFDIYAPAQYTDGTVNPGVLAPAFSITTDADGFASTEEIYVTENHDGTYSVGARQPGDRGGVPYGTYLIVQRNTTPGFGLLPPFKIFVGREGKTEYKSVMNGEDPSAVKIEKVDKETGLRVPYTATWQIIDLATGQPVEMVTHYPTEEHFTEFVSDADGNLTLPEKLPMGDYELKEITAPSSGGIGYIVNPVNVPFTVTGYSDWDHPIIVTMEDAPAKAVLQIIKSDGGDLGGYVEGAVYTITAANDIYTLDGAKRASEGELVGTVSTDPSGRATTAPLYVGRYFVQETESPDGYEIDTIVHEVNLSYEDQTVLISENTLLLTDRPTEFTIVKTDALNGMPISGTEFTLTSPDDAAFKQVGVTDEDGRLKFSYLPHGRYALCETKAAPGYKEDSHEREFEVNDQGQIENLTDLTEEKLLPLTNEPIPPEVGVQVDKDTIKMTSAGFVSLPGEKAINNVGVERYPYSIDFRNTSTARVDEFTVDDPLKGVADGYIRVTDLWTPITWGDTDGFLNVWYKTNLTKDAVEYATASAMSTNPYNVYNPANIAKHPNTGYKLWAQDVKETERRHLTVASLALSPGEYITAIRLEYGSVEMGFTSKNYRYESKNGEHHEGAGIDMKAGIVDWTPNEEDAFSHQSPLSAEEVKGLQPATFLVVANKPLGEDVVIEDFATAKVARDQIHTDDDTDKVYTSTIGTFSLTPKKDSARDLTDGSGNWNGSRNPKTGDPNGKIIVFFALLALLSIIIIVATIMRYKRKRKVHSMQND